MGPPLGEFHLPPQIAKHPGETIVHDQWLNLHPIELFTHPGGMTMQGKPVFLYPQKYRIIITQCAERVCIPNHCVGIGTLRRV